MPENDRNDARRCRRLPPKGSTRLEVYRDPAGAGPDLAVRVLDISATGAKAALSEALPLGQLAGVVIYGPRLLAIAGTARVVWVKEEEDGTFTTGVEFAAPAGPESLSALARA